MHILHLATEKTWRGGENQLGYLLRDSQGLDLRHTVAVPAGAASAVRYKPYANILEVPYAPFFHPGMLTTLSRFLKTSDCDLIHAHTSKGHSVGLLLKKLGTRQPLIVHRRVETNVPQSAWARAKYLSPDIASYIAISKKIAADLSSGGVPQEKITIIPSAVDPAPYQAIDRIAAKRKLLRALALPEKAQLVLTVSHLSPLKGIDTFIEGFAKVSSQNPALHAVIIGDGEERGRLEALILKLNQASRITMLGFRTDIPELLSAGDILCLPSLWEGLGTILLDGILAGCTVIGTAVGGIPEIIMDGETGLLFQPRDHNGLAKLIQQLVDDPTLKQHLDERAKRHVAETFSLQALVQNTVALYRGVCG